MATIKSFSDLQQSKKLAEILPLETADMYYECTKEEQEYKVYVGRNIAITYNLFSYRNGHTIPCWSLAALLDALPRIEGLKPVLDLDFNYVQYTSGINLSATADNPIDACYEMILKLHELTLL